MSPRLNIDRADQIGVFLETTVNASKSGVGLPVLFGPNIFTRCFVTTLRRPRHIPYWQVLEIHHRVGLPDRGNGFAQEVAAGVADASVNTLDAGFRLLPVVAEFDLAAHRPLIPGEALFVLPETVAWRQKAAIAEGDKARYPNIDADGTRGLRDGLLHLALALDRYEPLAANMADLY
ncbi:hypothetical protein [Dechloromonas sp. ZS-1]|uniref:hypothetical protein n=1 Tax=Dechloromonas sp. ZS-1 TaxID=3138067 RepID=UPI0031FC3812